MSNNEIATDSLFQRVVSILEQARRNVARSVNTNMVIAYWLIGREIVEEVQKGKERTEYGKKILQELSIKLTDKYKKGFSETSLQYFRKLYLAYEERVEIPRHAGVELNNIKSRPGGVVFSDTSHHIEISSPSGSELQNAFSPNLSWSHYRALMRVKNCEARNFYGKEELVSQNRERLKADDDNPTVGLILCTEKNEAVAKYSVLNDKKQIFASKYMLYLPTEKELTEELKKERVLIEEYLSEKKIKKHNPDADASVILMRITQNEVAIKSVKQKEKYGYFNTL